jgi:hypothetical protein
VSAINQNETAEGVNTEQENNIHENREQQQNVDSNLNPLTTVEDGNANENIRTIDENIHRG